eukprot:TRINITY_DN51664_c0_g1_i1.p1 TRINITY_DN51664_c0_g1~~TRINITY_DN51664_c0_g1_i1.p1  ORF type:complete len:214 (+),score=1.89 TRINITY_DN51664_c0_g1_i1:141-782(+)
MCIRDRVSTQSTGDQHGKYVYHTNVVGWVGGTADSGVCGWTFKSLRFQGDESAGGSPVPYFSEGELKPTLFSTRNTFFNHLISTYALNPSRLEGKRALDLVLCPPTSEGDGCIELTMDQMHNFAGNSLFIQSESAQIVLCLSSTAKRSLLAHKGTANQLLNALNRPTSEEIAIEFPIEEIERLGGGSVRCLIAASTAFTPDGVEKIKTLVNVA